VGYGVAWFGHGRIEKNMPATFDHAVWSLAGDVKMSWLWTTGKLEAELLKHNITT
jgi:hypothetical protein